MAVALALAAGFLPLDALAHSPIPGFARANFALVYASGGVVWIRGWSTEQWARTGLRIAVWIGAISALMASLAFTARRR